MFKAYQLSLTEQPEIHRNFFELPDTAVRLAVLLNFFCRFAKFAFFGGPDIILWKTVIFLRLVENICVVYRSILVDLILIVGLNC